MAAVLLIVGGVWGEIFFAHKARIAGDKQLAQYEARADEANARALEAQLALEKFKTPRNLTLEQQHELTARLSQFKGERGTVIASLSTPESDCLLAC
jgi:hypothetical protein